MNAISTSIGSDNTHTQVIQVHVFSLQNLLTNLKINQCVANAV